jgi:hypothetical protein
VKRLFMLVLALLVAGEAWATTVVLTGGKRLDVASYTVSGSYVTVQYVNGRRESYPLSAVDLPATRDASGAKPSAAEASEPGGPHSPFLGARSSTGAGAVVVTDADVKHVEPPEAEEAKKKEEGEPEAGSPVVLVSYEKKKVSETEWEILATVANQGKTTVQGVSALMRVLDNQGKPVATGSGSMSGKLEPGKQGTITASVSVQGEPMQVAFDLTWQEIRPAPKPVGSPAPAPAAATPKPPAAAAPQAAAPAPPGWSVPSGSSPNSLPANLMAVPAPNTLGAPPQLSRGEPQKP